MRVSNGWNTDFGKIKFDVTLDEDDLKDLLEERGIPVDARLTVNEKFSILNNEGKAFAKFQLARVQPDMEAQLHQDIKRHQAARDLLLDQVAKRSVNEQA